MENVRARDRAPKLGDPAVVLEDEALDEPSPRGGQRHPDAPPVHRVAAAPDQARARAPVDEPDRALVEHAEAVRQVAHDGRPRPEAADEQEQLVLRRRDAGPPGRVLREAEEVAQRLSESREALIVRLLQSGRHPRHGTIISQYDIK